MACKLREWSSIDQSVLFQQEKDIAFNISFLNSSEKEREDFFLERVHHVFLYSLPQSLSPDASRLLHERFKSEELFPLHCIAAIPTLTDKGYQEEPILDVEKEMLTTLSEGIMKQKDLITNMCSANYSSCQRIYIQKEIEYLVRLGYIIARYDKGNNKV